MVGDARDLADRAGVLGHLQHLRSFRADRRRANRANAIGGSILAHAGQARDTLGFGTWQVHTMLSTRSDVVVLTAGPPREPFRALIKIAETPAAAEGLDWQGRALIAMHDDERLADWRALIPRVLAAGETDGVVYLVEEGLRGTGLECAMARPAIQETALRAAAEAIGRLHCATAREAVLDEEILDSWVNDPVRVLGEVIGQFRGSRGAHAALGGISDRLHTALEAQPAILSWVHGDYCPGNILTGSDGQISAIVDWEFAHPADLPSLDVVTLLITARMWTRRQEFGRVVCDLLSDPVWTASEAQLVASADDARAGTGFGIDTLVLLCWLRHTSAKFTRRSGWADRGLWMHANLQTVLEALAVHPR